jgi:hypothetical protein
VPEGNYLTKVRKRVDSFTHYPTLKLKVGQKSRGKVLYKIESPSRGSMESKKIVQDVNMRRRSDPEDGGPVRCSAADA